MIAIVDDDPTSLAFLQEVLARGGHPVAAYASAAAALAGLRAAEPQLVISDVVMPEMSGLEFRRAYGARFPERRTPFVFLSSLGDAADVVRGLDAGADDYLQKPVVPELLLAKVRAHLRRGSQSSARTFRGDLARFPFAKIVAFCELQGLSGDVEVESGAFRASIAFRGGAVVDRGPEDGEAVARAFDLDSGTFLIRTQPVDFGDIAVAAVPGAGAAPGDAVPLEPGARPAGRLSAVSVGERLVQLQTEYVTTPSPAVVSVALRDGRTLLKRATPATGSREVVERLVAEQHAALEREVRERLAGLAATPSAASPAAAPAASPAPGPGGGAASFPELFDAGLDAFLAADYPRALDLFERAQALEPGHGALQVNLAVVRRKLGR